MYQTIIRAFHRLCILAIVCILVIPFTAIFGTLCGALPIDLGAAVMAFYVMHAAVFGPVLLLSFVGFAMTDRIVELF